MLSKEKGLIYCLMAAGSNIVVGLLPIFWSLFQEVDSHILLTHRSFWTFTLLTPLILFTTSSKDFRLAFRLDGGLLLCSSFLIGVNWLTYIYAINHQHVFEASLAYFIAPILAIFLASIFLKEKMTPLKKRAVALACGSILFLLIVKHVFPLLGFVIAITFSLYGLLGKKINSKVTLRLWIETFLISAALFVLVQSPSMLASDFLSLSHDKQLLLPLSGILTIFPFFLLNTAIKNLPYSTVGILGYIVPTLIFLTGILHFHETIDKDQLLALFFIWLSVGVYIASLLKKTQKLKLANGG